MYKTISIQNTTYQQLHAIATRLSKPKSQVIDELVRNYQESMKGKEQKELEAYNAFVIDLAQRVPLPKGTKIKSEDLDKELAVLKDQEF